MITRNGMTIAIVVTIAVAVAACTDGSTDGATAARGRDNAAATCRALQPGRARTIVDRVPSVIQAQMTPTRDGGVVMVFASYRGTHAFPQSRFTVVGADASGCVRWRQSLAGGWPLARAIEANAGTVVVASTGNGRYGASLRIYTLSASTGQALAHDAFSQPGISGAAPTLLSDRRGDVATIMLAPDAPRSDHCCRPVAVKLTRHAGTRRWQRQVILAPSGQAMPTAVARPDGRLAIGYPRRGHYWVRTGTVAGRLGAPVDAGRLGGNFRGAVLALGANGTTAAVWQSGTYSRPWRLRVALRRLDNRPLARAVQIGFAAADNGTLFEGAVAARIDAENRATILFNAPNRTTAGQERVMCARSTNRGRFATTAFDMHGLPDPTGNTPIVLLDGSVSAAITIAVPDEDELGRTLTAIGSGCRARSSTLLRPSAGQPVQATTDTRDRVWLLTQPQPSVDAVRPLILTITKPAS
jgi:hypothetical protein